MCIVGPVYRVETCFVSMLGLRTILCVLLGQYKDRNMLSINVRAKGNTVRIRQCSFLSSLFKPVATV